MPQIIAVVTDLIFSTKITGTGKALGKPVAVVRTPEKLAEHLAAAGEAGALVIVDLNSAGMDVLEAIRAAKAHPSSPRVMAFLSHVQVELAQQARAAGADEVMARSGFVERLPQIIGDVI